ncbi:MAG: LysM peptidoglycan-binding domain-containing protein [bacterium]|nr:LysM peptidoglycan-binding domain-containing protein [bacterium]
MRALRRPFIFIFTLAVFGFGLPLNAQKDFTEITVAKGETLSVIAKKHLDDPKRWRELLKYNNVPKPDLIYPGMKLKIPDFLARRPIARVNYTRIVAEYFTAAASKWGPTRVDLNLFSKDRVRTREAGLLRLEIKNGLLTLGKNTIIVLDNKILEEQSSTRVLLQKGRLHSSFRSQKGSKFPGLSIETPAAVASVRGTELVTTVDEAENTTVGCYKGLVEVGAQGKTVEVPAGYGTFVKKGQPPSEPFLLPTAPQIDVDE